jgi:prepilin-type N-terminal cleavage/methylation domain-containing protein
MRRAAPVLACDPEANATPAVRLVTKRADILDVSLAIQLPNRRNRRAFTLVELVIVTLITAICAALAAPLLGRSDTSRLRAAARMLVADLDYAQAESITHGEALRVVVFDQSAGSYRIATAAAPATAITNPADKQPYTTTFGTGRAMQLKGVSLFGYSLGGDNKIQFGLYGQLDQTTNATVTLASGARKLTITIDAVSGEASVGSVQ